MAAGDAALLEPIAPNREILRVEAVHALQSLGAVTFVDLMLRRLVDSRGPALDASSLSAMHALYVAHRPPDAPVRSFEDDRDDLLAAVASMRGSGTGGSTVAPPSRGARTDSVAGADSPTRS